MDRRLFLTGLLGVAGTAALASTLPRHAEASTGDPLEDLRPPQPDGTPEWELAEEPQEEGIEVAQRGSDWRHHRRRRWRHGRRRYRRYYRRRRRYRHWRRRCWWRYGRRICRRRAVWIWGWF